MALHVGDIGKVIRVLHTDDQSPANPIDLTNQTAIRFRFKKPDGTTFDLAASPTGTPTDGYATADTVAGNLDQAGDYQLQSRVTFSDGDVIYSTKLTVLVSDVL